MTAPLMLALDWRIGMSGFPLTLWLTAGWVLLAAAAATLIAFLLRLMWYSLAEFVVEHSALAALAARGYRVRGDAGWPAG